MASTLGDVAKKAGVSVSTVSRALSNDRTHPVAPHTQERIWEAVQALQYQPNSAAQQLVRGEEGVRQRTGNVGLILGNVSYKFSDPFWAPILNGIDDELRRQEYHLRFAFMIDDLKHRHQRRLLNHAHIDGLILAGLRPFGDAIALDRTVVIEGGDDRVRWEAPLRVNVVTIEKRRSMYHLVEHLVRLGRHRFAFLGPASQRDERGEAFLQALAAQGVPFDPALYRETPWTSEGAYPFAQALLARDDRPDALVCGCDTIAIGAMRAAKERGLRLPDDLAITGFDDIAFARDVDPPLTTVHVPKEVVGRVAVRTLMERLTQPGLPPMVQTIPTSLVVRASCGARDTDNLSREPASGRPEDRSGRLS